MDGSIDLTDKLAKKHGPLMGKSVPNEFFVGAQIDCFYIFFLSFPLFLMALEPLFILIPLQLVER
ncbi:MAG: hypothetical protein LBI77_01750 [Puniceicoccales bacterium]|nr:hypothetical protein [Puniceicoccales bacterium]